MSTNLRLSSELTDALGAAALASGRSPQEIIRDAAAKELGLNRTPTPLSQAIRSGLVKPPAPLRDVVPTLRLPEGCATLDLLDLLDRDDNG